MTSEYQEEREDEARQAHQEYMGDLVTNYKDDMSVDEVESAIDEVTDCLANIWILHKKDEHKRNRLIIQQIESTLLNNAETAVENEYE